MGTLYAKGANSNGDTGHREDASSDGVIWCKGGGGATAMETLAENEPTPMGYQTQKGGPSTLMRTTYTRGLPTLMGTPKRVGPSCNGNI